MKRYSKAEISRLAPRVGSSYFRTGPVSGGSDVLRESDIDVDCYYPCYVSHHFVLPSQMALHFFGQKSSRSFDGANSPTLLSGSKLRTLHVGYPIVAFHPLSLGAPTYVSTWLFDRLAI